MLRIRDSVFSLKCKIYIAPNSTQAEGNHSRGEMSLSQRRETIKCYLMDIKWLSLSGTHSSCGYLTKAYTRSSGLKSQDRWEIKERWGVVDYLNQFSIIYMYTEFY